MPMRVQDQRGASVAELLVGVVVFAILILVMDAVFSNALRGSRKVELSAGVSQNARVALERLVAEIREASAAQIQIDGGGGAVIFRSARPSDAENAFCMDWKSAAEPLALANPGCSGVPLSGTYVPVWQRWIAYHFDTGSGLLRRIASPSALTFPVSGGQVIAASVETFAVELSGGTLTVTLKGLGQEMTQGANLPPQEIMLNASTKVNN
jgi:Tfp pilus assembly protein PilE